MQLAFTGTRHGMSKHQREVVRGMLIALAPTHVRHGDCLGADREFHDLVREVLPNCIIIVHPPKDTRLRAFCTGDQTMRPMPYLERNKSMVRNSDHLIATPIEMYPILRSGTWATVRFAQQTGKPTDIIYPRERLK